MLTVSRATKRSIQVQYAVKPLELYRTVYMVRKELGVILEVVRFILPLIQEPQIRTNFTPLSGRVRDFKKQAYFLIRPILYSSSKG